MALNIGSINFGVDANTAGLQKAIAQLNQFQKKTDEVARSQSKGAQAVATAMSRQETAIRKAFQATLNLQRQLRASGVPPEQIARVSNAFQKLTRDLTSGKISIVEYNRAMDAFNAKLGRSRREMNEFNAANKASHGAVGKMSILLRDLESSAVLAVGPLSGVGARIRSLGSIAGRSSLKIALIAGAVVGAAVALFKVGQAAVRAGQEMKGLLLRFDAASGSLAQGKAEYKFTIDLARRLGLEVNVLAKSYSRFLAASQGTSIEGEKSQKIFTQIARSAAALKLSGEDVEGVMRALEQIMSKGTVQAEELRGQLGDRLPGAFRVAADAMGLTTSEMNRQLKAGKILSDDFLPKFAAAYEAAVGKNAQKNLETITGQWNNLKTSTGILLADLDDITGLSKGITNVLEGSAKAMTFLAGESRILAETTEEAAENAERLAKVAVPQIKLTAVYTDMNKELEKMNTELMVQKEALGFLGRAGNDLDFLLDFFTVLPEAMTASQDDLKALADNLMSITGLQIEATAEGIAAGFAEMAAQAREASERIDFLKNAPEVLRDINEEMAMMRDRAAALAKGPEAAEQFDTITAQAAAFKKVLEGTTKSEEDRNDILLEYIALITQIDALEKANTETARAREQAIQAAARAQEKANGAIEEAGQAISTMRLKMKALSRGPDSLEAFEKVEEPLIQFKERLMEAGVAMSVINSLSAEYKELLEEQFRATDRWARANEQAAAAITSGLEDVIFKGESVKDMLHALAKELLRVAIRALFLDKLQAGLSNFFNDDGFPGVQRTPVAASTGIPGVGTGPYARGGAFKIGGSGGADTKSVNIQAKAGEIVSVRRPDQMGSRGMGGGVTVVQENHFHNSGNAETLIPVLEENNRKLKGEILDDIDRGAL